MRGRAFLVSAPGLKKRTVQEKLASGNAVVDAVIQGELVRLVLESGAVPDAGRLLPGVAGVSIQPVPPRLEDRFVAMLRQRHPAGGTAPRRPPAPQNSKRGNNGTGPVIEVNHVQR
jgi:ABC-2 type transport system ATP-binding protein